MTAPKTCLALRHVPFEDMGSFAAVLAARGYAIAYREAPVDDLAAREWREADLVVLLGGPIGVYEAEAYPFVRGEIALAAWRLAQDRPLLGLCLGSQMMAAALGARVHPGAMGKEIGWAPLDLTAVGASSPLAHLGPTQASVLHWHGDTFDLPPGATLLASTPRYANQAFAFGKTGLALQFHPEVTARGLEAWYVGHCCEIGATPGIDVPGLRAAAAAHAPALARQGPRFFAAWLDSCGLA